MFRAIAVFLVAFSAMTYADEADENFEKCCVKRKIPVPDYTCKSIEPPTLALHSLRPHLMRKSSSPSAQKSLLKDGPPDVEKFVDDLFYCLNAGQDNQECCKDAGVEDPCLDYCLPKGFDVTDKKYESCSEDVKQMNAVADCMHKANGNEPEEKKLA